MDLYDVRNALTKGKSIYDLPLRVTFYARVSTGSDEQAHSLSNQISYYSDFIGKNPCWTYVDGYIDEALSGTSVTKREAFLRMIDHAKEKRFDFIITKEISRFSRNTLDSIQYSQLLLQNGVGVLFQSDNINTLMPDAELRLTIMSSIAQDEVRKISERVKFGFRRAIEKGTVLGNSKIWGYVKDGGRLLIVPEEAEMVRQIFDLYATQNVGIRGICTWLNQQGYKNTNGGDFSFSTIRGILTNPKYMGYYCGNKTSKYDYKLSQRKFLDEADWVMYKDEDNVPPIVSEALWQKANDILRTRSKKQSAQDRTSYQNKYAYSGKIYCAAHNTAYYRGEYRYKANRREVWQCREYAAKGKAGCSSPILYSTELDVIIREILKIITEDKHTLTESLMQVYTGIINNSQIHKDILVAQGAMGDIQKRKDKLLDLSIQGLLTNEEFLRRNEQFNTQLALLEEKVGTLKDNEQLDRQALGEEALLHRQIEAELEFGEGNAPCNSDSSRCFGNALVDSLLDKIIVGSPEDDKTIKLEAHFKIFSQIRAYRILRGRGNTSVRLVEGDKA